MVGRPSRARDGRRKLKSGEIQQAALAWQTADEPLSLSNRDLLPENWPTYSESPPTGSGLRRTGCAEVDSARSRSSGCSRSRRPGAATAELCCRHGISEQTFYRWKQKYGGLEGSEAKRLKALEEENARLKRLVAEQALDHQMLKDLLENTGEARGTAAGRGLSPGTVCGVRASRLRGGRDRPPESALPRRRPSDAGLRRPAVRVGRRAAPLRLSAPARAVAASRGCRSTTSACIGSTAPKACWFASARASGSPTTSELPRRPSPARTSSGAWIS